MKKQESDFYEKLWKREGDKEVLFQDTPNWQGTLGYRTEFFGQMIHGKILDVGCGEGDFSFSIAKRSEVNNVTGLDISTVVVQRCQARVKEEKLGKKMGFKVGSVTDLSIKTCSVDSLFAFEVVEHIIDVDRMFKEFNRVLKNGGCLGLTTVDFNLLKRVIIAVVYFETYFDPLTPHIRFFTKKTLEKLLNRYGFKVVKYEWEGSYFGLMPTGQMVIAKKYKDL